MVDHLQCSQQPKVQGDHRVHEGVEVRQWDGDQQKEQQDPVACTDLGQCHSKEDQGGNLVHVELQQPPNKVNQGHYDFFGLHKKVDGDLVTSIQLRAGLGGGGEGGDSPLPS